MKQTVAQLFGTDSGKAYIPLLWGGRRESPAELAARAWSTMGLVMEHFRTGDSRYEDAQWIVLADDGLHFIPAPDSLSRLEELAVKSTPMSNGEPDDPTSMQLILAPDGVGYTSIASVQIVAGEELTTIGNTVTLSFKQDYALGTAAEVSTLFRGLLRIWQPDAGILSTIHTINEIPDLYDTYAGYLSWVSRAAFGTPPPVAAAAVEAFGDGALLTARTWTVQGVGALHEELHAAGVPALSKGFPMKPQEVPAFPLG